MGFLNTAKTPTTPAAPVAPVGPANATGFLGTVNAPQATSGFLATSKIPDAQVQASVEQQNQNPAPVYDPSSQSGPLALLKSVASSAWNTVKSVGSGIISAYTKPDTYEQSMENSAPAILKPIDMVALRTLAPVTEQFAKDAAGAIVLNNPTLYKDFTDAITSTLPKSAAEQDADAGIENFSNKTPLQVVGDVSSAVFSAVAPDLFGEKLGTGLLPAAIRNASIGFAFGLTQVASSGTKDPATIANMLLQSTIAGTAIGLAGEAVSHGLAKSVPEAVDAMQNKIDTLTAPEAPPTSVPEEVTAQRTQTHAEYARSQGYEPYVADSELPTIDTGPKAKSGLPEIQIGDEETPIKAPPGLKYEPVEGREAPVLKPIAKEAVEAPTEKAFVKKVSATITPEAEQAVKVRTNTDVAAPKEEALTKFYQAANKFTDSEKTVSGLAESVKQDAIKAGIKADLGDLPKYGVMNMDHQAEMAQKLIADDPEYAMKVAKGEVAPPNTDLQAGSVYSTFRVLADKSDDIEAKTEIYRQLAEHSNTTEQARAAGQFIKSLDTGLTHDDPVSIIRDVQEAREQAVEAKSKGTFAETKKEMADDIKTEIKKAVSKRQSWDDFINEIQCKY